MSLRRSSAAALAALLALAVLLGTSADDGGQPIVARISKDTSTPTPLYTIAIKVGGVPLLLDLGGPMLWLANCPTPHRIIPCVSHDCDEVSTTYRPPGCPKPSLRGDGPCACPAYPRNPVDGRCRSDDATTITLAANTTDGQNPLLPVIFRAVGSCAPGELLESLPAGAAGVAGLSRLPLSLPTQFASLLKVANEFALCLPSGGDGVAVFGGGPFQLLAAPPVELAERLRENPLPLLKHPYNGGYYFGITGVAVNQQRVPTPDGVFDLDAGSGTGGAVFSTVTPYTALRWDIYWPLRNAFDVATSGVRAHGDPGGLRRGQHRADAGRRPELDAARCQLARAGERADSVLRVRPDFVVHAGGDRLAGGYPRGAPDGEQPADVRSGEGDVRVQWAAPRNPHYMQQLQLHHGEFLLEECHACTDLACLAPPPPCSFVLDVDWLREVLS
ncbi:hypothetical protein VPH35_047435 [Triticum aestivum]